MTKPDQPEDHPPDQPAPASPDKAPASPHDTFVYKILSDPVLAAAELKAVLPQEIADEIAWETLELDTHRFVTGNLANQYTDLLFKTTIRHQDIRIRILLEHSSHSKPFELLQTLQYQVRQWERGWRGHSRFIDYFGLDEALVHLLRPYIVDFGIVLDDISKVNTEALMARPVPPEVQLMLFALRYGRTGRRVLDELPKIAPILTVLLQEPNGRLVLGVFLVYLKRVAKVSEAEMRSLLQEVIEPQLDPEMVAVWTQFEAGEKKGRLEGELKGRRTMLRRLLTQRFGTLSPENIARLESASLEDLDAMTLRVLTAASADEVLAEPPR